MDGKEALSKFLSSYKTSIALMLLYASLLAMATFIEKFSGTETAKSFIYYSPLFILLQLLLVINYLLLLTRRQLLKKKKWGSLIVHFALIIILTGAFISHLFGREGSIHLREGETTGQMLVRSDKGESLHPLPFSIRLEEFTLSRYPGSSSPSSFESKLLLHSDGVFEKKTLSMNNIIDIKGYRLFQSSYDRDEKGTILSVNKDQAGRTVTYTGYALLLIGFILFLTGRNSRFRQLLSALKEVEKGSLSIVFIACFSILPLSLTAQDPSQKIVEAVLKNRIPEQQAAQFGAIPMQSPDGRIEPVNTFSSEVLRKLHHSDRIGGLNPDQFLLSVLTLPDMWMHIPLIAVSNKEIVSHFDLTEGDNAYIALFDTNGQYKLRNELNEAFTKPASERNRFDKDLIKLDEQVNILHQLLAGKMIRIFPDKGDASGQWYAPGDDLSSFTSSDALFIRKTMEVYLQRVREGLRTGDWQQADKHLAAIVRFQQENNQVIKIVPGRMKAELLYNKLDVFRLCKKAYLILGGMLLLFSFSLLFRNRKWITWMIRIWTVCIVTTALYHLSGLLLRGYIAGYGPWSNSYETMLYVALITVVAGLLFIRQSKITFALATLFGGIILFVSGLNWMNPQITPLVPVLQSPWLMVHVAVIVAAYGFLGIGFLSGATNLVLLKLNKKSRQPFLSLRIKELYLINELTLWIGLALMTTGTFIGAIWANESWGRYWGWDPKETWALITIVVYAVVTHVRLIKKQDTPALFSLLSVLAFLSVLMTYFGVNYFFNGMHSYG